MERDSRKPNLFLALVPLIIVIASLIYFVIIKGGAPHIAIVIAIALTALIGKVIGFNWKEMLDSMVKASTSVLAVIGILMAIGMLVGSWIISGTVPLLMVYGFEFITPSFFLPAVCLIGALISLATGTSWGTLGTIGLVFMGIGEGLGVPAYLTAGAVVSGAFFGDKVSPLSDTTNFCSGLVGANLYKHIAQLMPSTIPSLLIGLVLYWVLGLEFGDQQVAATKSMEMKTALNSAFNLNPILLIPPLVVIVMAVKRLPPMPTLFTGIILGVVLALILQDTSIEAILGTVMYGFRSNTGLKFVDSLLSKGGLNSMFWISGLMILTVAISGLYKLLGTFQAVLESISKIVKGLGSAVVSASASMLLLIFTSDLYIGYTVTAKVFGPIFRGWGYSVTNVSRVMENSGTMMTALVPWGAAGVYVTSMLGVPTLEYAPVAFVCWFPLIFDAVWGFTGVFMPKATSHEKEEWIKEDRLVVKEGKLVKATA